MMRIFFTRILVLFGMLGFYQVYADGIGSDYQEYIKNGQPIAVHVSDFSDLVVSSEAVISNSFAGDVFANSIPGSGNFYVKARIRIANMGGTAASFQLGKNYFGFDGRQNDIYLNGPIFGKEVISLRPNKDLLQNSEWFDFEIVREDSLISFMINSAVVHQITYDGEFSGKMGFHPIRANMEISEFSARGTLIPISLMPPDFSIPIIDLAYESHRQVLVEINDGSSRDKFKTQSEPGVVRSPDGKQVAMLLRAKGQRFNSTILFSDDEGQTWSEPLELPSSLSGDRHKCLYAKDGRLVITFMDYASRSPMQGDFVAWVGKYDDLLNQSEGQYRVRLLDNKIRRDYGDGDSEFEIYPDGSFYAATYGKWEKDHSDFVMGTRFTLEEIDRKVTELPHYIDVFVEGEDGYNTYRIPALWKSSKGSILAFAEGRESMSDHAANDIVLKRSLDGGESWGSLQVVAEQGDDCLNNPMIVEDQRNSRLILMWQKYPEGYHERQVGPGYDSDTICSSYVQYSMDDGITWTSPRDITQMVKRPTWVTSIAGGPGNGIQITKGPYKNRLVMPFNQGPAPKWKVYAVYSDDGGETWEYGEIAFESDKGNGNEVQMVELSDGSIMLNSRSSNGQKLRKSAISRDGGANWTGLKDEEQLIESQCMGSIISLTSDNLSIPVLIFSNPYTQTGRRFGTLQVSLDDGQTWISNKCVYNGSFAYSSLANMGNEEIGLLFERDDYTLISFLKTKLDWLLRTK